MRYLLCLLTAFAVGLTARAQDNPDEPRDVPEGKVRLTLEPGGHTSIIARVLFTPDNSQIITLSHDGSIRVWDVESGECVGVMYPPLSIYPGYAQLSPDGKRLAVSRVVQDKDNKRTYSHLLISPAESRVERVLTGPILGPSVLAFSPDGKRLAGASSNKTTSSVSVWDLEKDGAEPEKTFAGPGIARSLAFSPGGKQLAQAGEWAGVLDAESGKAVNKFTAGVAGDKVAWSPNGKTIALATHQGLELWDPDGKKPRAVFEKGARFASAAFSADSQTVLASEFAPPPNQERVRTFLYDVGSGRSKKTFEGEPLAGRKPGSKPPPGELHQVDERVHDSALSPNGKYAAAVGRQGGHQQVLLWNTSDGKIAHRLSSRSFYSVPDAPIGWTKDGKTIVWNQGIIWKDKPLARGFTLDDAAKDEGLRFLMKPPDPVPALWIDKGGLHFMPPNGEKSFNLYQGNATKIIATITSNRPQWHATFFGRDHLYVALHGEPFSVYEASNGKLAHNLKGHHSYVLNIAVSPGHEFLASASWDQVIRVHKAGDTAPLFSLYAAGKDWVVWTEEGYYAASPGGEQFIGWVVETSPNELAEFQPASRFRSRMYRPDVIRLLLKEKSVAKALKKADEDAGKNSKEVKTAAAVADLLPEVKVDSQPRKGTKPKDGKLTITAEAKTKGEDPITELQLLVDDRPYGGEKGHVVLPKPDKSANKTWDVDLGPGKHNIRVLARTGAALGSSRGMVREAEDDAGAAKKKEPALYVLAVGVNDYKAVPKLGGAVNDANEFEGTLQKYSKPLFSKYESKKVLDKDATREGILKGLDWLQEKQTASDIAVVYFAGHGDVNNGEFYLLPQDTDPKDMAKTALSRAEFKKRMQVLPGRVVVVLDACHSGAIGLLFDDVSRQLVDEDCGVVVICAASPKQLAQEKKNGFLTLALMEGLSGKAGKRDGRVYLHHLPPYLIDQVAEMSKDSQHPIVVVPPWLHSFGLSKP
jgi:WD40 repeat protein